MGRGSRRLDKLVEAVQPAPPPRIVPLPAGRPTESLGWLLSESRRMARWRRARSKLADRRAYYAVLRACLALARDGLEAYAALFAQTRRMAVTRGIPEAAAWARQRYMDMTTEPPYLLDPRASDPIRFYNCNANPDVSAFPDRTQEP